jgi:hypothetical protein
MNKKNELYGVLEINYDCNNDKPSVTVAITVHDSLEIAKKHIEKIHDNDQALVEVFDEAAIENNFINENESLVELADDMFYHRAIIVPLKPGVSRIFNNTNDH